MSHEQMTNAAIRAFKELFKIDSKDKVLILTDDHCNSIGSTFMSACENLNVQAVIFKIEEQSRPLKEPPEELIKLLSEKSIVLNIIKAYSDEIPFRIKWIFKVEENKKIKMGHMPGITEAMMLGSVNVDYSEMRRRADELIQDMKDIRRVQISTEEGTDLVLGMEGRNFISDVGVKPGEMCNLPCGEIYCAPLENKANGVVVFNASIGDIGVLNTQLKVYLSEGRITKFESDDKDLIERISKLQNVDNDSMVIGELGIGINPKAIITGNMLEDEKSLGTAHIAFGNNADFPGGGNNDSNIHRDYLFYRPTINIEYATGTNRKIMEKGILS